MNVSSLAFRDAPFLLINGELRPRLATKRPCALVPLFVSMESCRTPVACMSPPSYGLYGPSRAPGLA